MTKKRTFVQKNQDTERAGATLSKRRPQKSTTTIESSDAAVIIDGSALGSKCVRKKPSRSARLATSCPTMISATPPATKLACRALSERALMVG